MSGLKDWSGNPANNIANPPNGWPEGMAPSAVNNSARQMMADVRTWYENAQWVDYGHIPVYASTSSFVISGDVTGLYHVGRRLRLDNNGFVYSVITASSYSSPNTTVIIEHSALSIDLNAVALAALTAVDGSLPENVSLRAAVGSAAHPAYTFHGDADTGFYRGDADRLDAATNGTRRLSIQQGLVVDVNEADPGQGNAVVNDMRVRSINGGPLSGFRNAIINGAFDVWQRGTSFAANGYTADRWQCNYGAGGSGTVSRAAMAMGATVGDGTQPGACLQWNQTGAGSGNYLLQPIEGVRNFAGQQVTLSFYAKAVSGTVDLSCYIRQHFGTGGSPSANVDTGLQTAGLTTSWQRFSYSWTLDSVAGKNLGSNNNDYVGVIFTGPGAATFNVQLWGVQLEKGPIPTAFEMRTAAVEIPLCQRYYWKSFKQSVAPAQNAGREGAIMVPATGITANLSVCAQVLLPVSMRTMPSITTYNPSANNANWRNIGASTDLAVNVDTTNLTEQSLVIFNGSASADNALYGLHVTANAEF
jgi:hypothetical protein